METMPKPEPAPPPLAPGALLACAITIAAQAHETQLDKADAPYILHPLRMMARAQSLPEQVVAVLHDVVEDGGEKYSIRALYHASMWKISVGWRGPTPVIHVLFSELVPRK